MSRIRTVFFWLHLTAGVVAGVVVLIMSITGVALTYEKQVLEWADRGAWSAPSSDRSERLSPETLLARVREARPEAAPTMLTLRADPAAPATVTFEGAGAVLVDPSSGQVIGAPPGGLRAFFRVMTSWHRWLALEGPSRTSGQGRHRRGEPRVPVHRPERHLPVAAEDLEPRAVPADSLVPPPPVVQGEGLQLAQRHRHLVGDSPRDRRGGCGADFLPLGEQPRLPHRR